MSLRNFPNFLDSYMQYARDGYCDDSFHKWTGVAIISAALQRKVSLKQGKINHIPNMYVMLVSHPGVGKSTAMDAGVDLIEEMKRMFSPQFRIIPNQATEPALIDLMKITDRINIPGSAAPFSHSSGFFYASEASSSALQNICGDFVSALTAFYDCPKFFRKKLKGEQTATEIENGCITMLAGATFAYLKELVNEKSVLGGFASRLIYVVAKERKVREATWDNEVKLDPLMKQKLIQDLSRINKLIGPVLPTQGFIDKYLSWRTEFDNEVIGLGSDRLESMISRKGTNIIKLSIILSVAASDDMVVSEKHFEEAKLMIDETTKDNAFVISQAMINNKQSQAGLNIAIMQIFEKNGGFLTLKNLRKFIMSNGNDARMINSTIDMMISSGIIEPSGEDKYKLTVSSAESV